MKRSYIKKKKTEWDYLRAKLKIVFEKAGITRCEKCKSRFALGFAHAVKRRNLREYALFGSPEHIETVVLLCNSCHDAIEVGKSHEFMKNEVMRIISERKIQPEVIGNGS